MASEDEWDTALTIPEAFVYKIPPRTSAQGYKASDWKDQVAVVRVQVVTRGTEVAVRLIRVETGKIFAVAPVRVGGPAAVEQVTDSSRYFALRIENDKGNHAFIGLGLNKREDAFDLKSCLADVARSAEAEVSGAGVDLGIDGVSSDMLSGLKAGQTFTIKVGGAGGAGAKAPAPAAAARPLGSGRLAPPGSVPAPAPAAPAPAAPAPAAPAASTSSWETF